MKSLSLLWQILSVPSYSLFPFGCTSSFLQLLEKNWGEKGRNCVCISRGLKNCWQYSRVHQRWQFSTICITSYLHRREVGGEQKWSWWIIAIKLHLLAKDGSYQMWQSLLWSQRHTRSVILLVWPSLHLQQFASQKQLAQILSEFFCF